MQLGDSVQLICFLSCITCFPVIITVYVWIWHGYSRNIDRFKAGSVKYRSCEVVCLDDCYNMQPHQVNTARYAFLFAGDVIQAGVAF